MKILAIDTATEGCSVCLWQDGESLSRMDVQPRKHAELILPMIDEVLDEAGLSLNQLDTLAFGRGPGAFTGVRIATGVIQGIAYGADLPVVPVSTLRALAQRAYVDHDADKVLSAFDARMHEVYFAAYQLDGDALMQPVVEEMVVKPDALVLNQAIDKDWAGAGSGWSVYKTALLKSLGTELNHIYPDLITRADEIALLAATDYQQGKAVSAELALPVYLRNEVAWKKSS
jgi:tRNA threonylcarbamoyladenosine biosynthesis protein TsaB